MSFECHVGTREEIQALGEIEKNTTPGNRYLIECADEFLDPAMGELVVASEHGQLCGFGHFSIQPDGSGWLECLRVDPKHQKRGCGTAIWGRFMELCEIYGVPHVGMYTGLKNYGSRVLGERNGLEVAYQNREGTLMSTGADGRAQNNGFSRITDPDDIKRAIEPYTAGYHGFFSMNRTYNYYSDALYKYLSREQSVWVKGESVIVLGARFLRDRGLFIGMMGGDIDDCLTLAEAELRESGLPKLSAAIPSDREDLAFAMEKHGFSFPQAHIIVLERNF